MVFLPFNSTFELKFSSSTGDEWNLIYNKNSNNYILTQPTTFDDINIKYMWGPHVDNIEICKKCTH